MFPGCPYDIIKNKIDSIRCPDTLFERLIVEKFSSSRPNTENQDSGTQRRAAWERPALRRLTASDAQGRISTGPGEGLASQS